MRFLLTISLCGLISSAVAEGAYLLIQRAPLAGSQYYAVSAQWNALQVGDRLDLVREPANRHDTNAIRVDWRGQPLGYVPRSENGPLARAMDEGDRLLARIVRLNRHPDPWRRVEFEVLMAL